MAYTKTTWKDRLVEFANRFAKSNETATSVTLTPDPGTITEAGTPLSAANLNKIEQGIADAHSSIDTHAARADNPHGVTAAQVGAVNKAGDTMSGPLNFTDVTTNIERVSTSIAIRSGEYSFVTAKNTSHVTGNAYWNGTDWNRYDTTKPSVMFRADGSKGEINLYTALAAANPITWSGPYAIWHAGNTPQIRNNAGVLEFLSGGVWKPVGGIKSVQRGLTNVANSATTNVTISSVNMNKAYANLLNNNGDGGAYYHRYIRLTSATNLEIYNGEPSTRIISWEVIEFY